MLWSGNPRIFTPLYGFLFFIGVFGFSGDWPVPLVSVGSFPRSGVMLLRVFLCLLFLLLVVDPLLGGVRCLPPENYDLFL